MPTDEQRDEIEQRHEMQRPIGLSEKSALRKKVLGLELDTFETEALGQLDEDAVALFVDLVRNDDELFMTLAASQSEKDLYSPASKLGKLGIESEADTLKLMGADDEGAVELIEMSKSASRSAAYVAHDDYHGNLDGDPLRIGGVTGK